MNRFIATRQAQLVYLQEKDKWNPLVVCLEADFISVAVECTNADLNHKKLLLQIISGQSCTCCPVILNLQTSQVMTNNFQEINARIVNCQNRAFIRSSTGRLPEKNLVLNYYPESLSPKFELSDYLCNVTYYVVPIFIHRNKFNNL